MSSAESAALGTTKPRRVMRPHSHTVRQYSGDNGSGESGFVFGDEFFLLFFFGVVLLRVLVLCINDIFYNECKNKNYSGFVLLC
jgi:hypothetical protein